MLDIEIDYPGSEPERQTVRSTDEPCGFSISGMFAPVTGWRPISVRVEGQSHTIPDDGKWHEFEFLGVPVRVRSIYRSES